MAGERLFELRETSANGLFGPTVGQGSRIVAEEQHTWGALHRSEGSAKCCQVVLAQALRLSALGWQGVRFEDQQGHQGGRHSQEHVGPDLQPPARLQAELLSRPMPACQPQSPDAAKSAQLSKFMVAKIRPHLRTELLTHFGQALPCAFKSGIVADTDPG